MSADCCQCLCDEIKKARDEGAAHCGVLDGTNLTVDDVTTAMGLRPCKEVQYKAVDAAMALDIATLIPFRSLAYNSEIIPLERSKDLASRFLALFPGQPSFFTNGSFKLDEFGRYRITLSGWNPPTDSTFDTGIIVIGGSRAGCLWMEDED